MLRDGRPGPRYTLGTALIRLGDIARGQLPLGDSAAARCWPSSPT